MGLFAGLKARAGRRGTRDREVAALRAQLNTALAFEGANAGAMVGESRMTNYTAYLEAVKIPNVYAALSVIAYSYASAPLQVFVESHQYSEPVNLGDAAPDLEALLRQPNPFEEGFTFLERQVMDLLLTGNHIVAMDNADGYGRPHELYRMRPDRTRIIVDAAGQVRYGYGVGGTLGPSQTFDRTEILHWKFANPLDPLWGLGVIEAGESVFSRDRLINDYLRAYFERGAILEGAIKLQPGQSLASEAEYNKLIRRFRAAREQGRAKVSVGVLEDGADYKQFQEPLGSLRIEALAKLSRNEVLQLFGVPPPKVGDFGETNYRNSQEADAFFAMETMDPLWTRGERRWTDLVKRWQPHWIAHFLRPTIPVDIESKAKAVLAMSQSASFRRNDLRAVTGHQPLPDDDPRGEEIVSTARALEAVADTTPDARMEAVPPALTPDAVADEGGDQE